MVMVTGKVGGGSGYLDTNDLCHDKVYWLSIISQAMCVFHCLMLNITDADGVWFIF